MKNYFLKLFYLLLLCLMIPSLSFSQDLLPKLDQFKSIQKDTLSYYYKEIWLKSKDINDNNIAGFLSRANSKIESGYFKEAMQDVEKAISLDSTIGRSYCLKGFLMLRSDSLESALTNFNKSVMLNDTNIYNYYYRAEIYSRMKKFHDADYNYNKAININKKFAEAYFGLANLQIMKFRYKEAEELYKKVISLNPSHSFAYFNLGLLNLLTDQNKAMKYFNKSIEFNPTFAHAYFIRGFIENSQGSTGSVYSDWNKAVELDPNNSIYLRTLGLLNIVAKNYETGFDQVTKALLNFKLKNYISYFEDSPRDKITNDFMSQVLTYKLYSDKISGNEKGKIKIALSLFFTGKFKEAEEIYSDLTNSSSVPGLIYYLRAYNLEYLQEAAFSLENYELSIRQEIFPMESYLRSGIVLNFLGRYHEAISRFKVYIGLNDSVRLVHRSLAGSYINLAQFDSAIYVLDKLITSDTSELDVYFDRAYCLKKLEKFQEAINDCSHIINLQPRNIETICLLAECQYSTGDTTSAYKTLNEGYKKIFRLTEEGYFIRGTINLHYKNYDSAINDFEEVINLNPKHTEAFIYRGLCYFCKEDYKNAKSDLTYAINLDNNEMISFYTRGLVNIKLNKLNEAWADLTKAQFLGHPLARRAILLYLKNFKPPDVKS